MSAPLIFGRRLALALAAVAALAVTGAALTGPAAAGPQFVVAVNGYDPVSYFTEDGPAPGVVTISHHWNGATWLFASEENRDRFAADPTRYAPRFDGYCAFAASRGYKAPGDPEVWRVVDGRLYLNATPRAQTLWEEDIPGNIATGEENWPRLNAL